MTGGASRRVIKIGGSLLRRRDLVERFGELLRSLPAATNSLVVVGGGARADAVRELQKDSGCDDATAHWAAIDAMTANARAFAAAADLPCIDWPADRPPAGDSVVLLADWLRGVEPARLPRDWSATSDSIAAVLAAELDAELLLAKSAPPPATTRQAAAAAGYVDAFFPTAAAGLSKVACVVLAADSPTLTPLHAGGRNFSAGRST